MLHVNLMRLARQQGVRRSTIKLRPLKPALADKRTLRGIINKMVAHVYQYVPALVEHVRGPVLQDEAGEFLGYHRDSIESIDHILNLIVQQTQNVMTILHFQVRDWSERVERRQRDAFSASVFTATKVDLSTVLERGTVDKTVGHYVAWATSLIRDVGDEARKRIANEVLRAVRENIAPAELARTLRDTEEMSYRRALNIASDQTTKLNAALDRARQQEVGITAFTWIHSGSPHPREWHEERDGEVFEWDGADIDPGDYPGEPPFCGCIAQATIVDDQGNADDTSTEGEDVATEEG